jgi:hypothetical protein
MTCDSCGYPWLAHKVTSGGDTVMCPATDDEAARNQAANAQTYGKAST